MAKQSWESEQWFIEQTPRWDKLVAEGWEFADLKQWCSVGIAMRREGQSAEFAIVRTDSPNWREQINTELLRRCEAFAEIFKQADKAGEVAVKIAANFDEFAESLRAKHYDIKDLDAMLQVGPTASDSEADNLKSQDPGAREWVEDVIEQAKELQSKLTTLRGSLVVLQNNIRREH